MKSVLALGTLFSSALAAPLVSWSPALGEFYAAVDRHIQLARQEGTVANPPTCDLSKAVQPVAPTPLPAPGPSWSLAEVVIGRGVQVCSPTTFTQAHTLTRSELYLLIRFKRCSPQTNRRNRLPLQRLLHSGKLPGHPHHVAWSSTPVRSPS